MSKIIEGLLILFNMENKWICTDPSCNQYRKDLPDGTYLFKEDRIKNPETKETYQYSSIIDLNDYNWWDIIEACETFGYTAEQVDDWLTWGEELDLIAECLFELEIE
jgi:hypothetical protein